MRTIGRWAAFTVLAAGLSACEDGAPERNVAKVRIAVPASDKIAAMTPLYRFLSLRRAVVDSGQRCKKVDTGQYQQDYNNLAMWVAHCTDTGDWAIFIAPNDDVQVRACKETEQLKLPACRPLPEAEAKAADGKAKAARAR